MDIGNRGTFLRLLLLSNLEDLKPLIDWLRILPVPELFKSILGFEGGYQKEKTFSLYGVDLDCSNNNMN